MPTIKKNTKQTERKRDKEKLKIKRVLMKKKNRK